MDENNYYLKKSKAVLREVRKSVIGKDDVICKVYMAIIAGGHVLLSHLRCLRFLELPIESV